MSQRWLMKAGEGRLLVRASATFLCVRRGVEFDKTSLKEFTHKILTNVDMARKLTAH